MTAASSASVSDVGTGGSACKDKVVSCIFRKSGRVDGTYGHGHGQEIMDRGHGHKKGHMLSDNSCEEPPDIESTSLHPAVHPITKTSRNVARNPVIVLEPQDPIPDVVLNAHEHDVDDVLTPDVPDLNPTTTTVTTTTTTH